MNDEHNKSERYASHSQKAAYYLVWLCRHPETGTVCSEGEGGVWKKESPTTSAKYLARGVCV